MNEDDAVVQTEHGERYKSLEVRKDGGPYDAEYIRTESVSPEVRWVVLGVIVWLLTTLALL